MSGHRPRILVITPVNHISGITNALNEIGDVTYLDDPSAQEVISCIGEYEAVFTNPNKSRVYLGREVLDAAEKLKVICTASTGTNHIDKAYAGVKGVDILALTEERDVINRISSTAEHAFALTLASLRNVVRAHNAVLSGEWDYTRYIGRQMNCLTVGVVGYGRLGSFYASYCSAFGAKVLVYDPYKRVSNTTHRQVDDLDDLLIASDIVALHVHVTDETLGMINAERFSKMKDDVIIVNTSRGDVVNEWHLVSFLQGHQYAKMATDVIADEINNKKGSPLLEFACDSNQVTITPHIGGMTRDAQEIAYGHAVHRLSDYCR